MIDIILQIFAGALPIISFYLVAENNKWGFIVGIACQPFWFYLTISNQSWGLVAATVFYTLIHIKGIYKEFIKKKKKMNKKVIIMRGIPGSGKTYIAKKLAKEYQEKARITTHAYCSADNYWLLKDNDYNFNINNLGKAHIWCMNNFLHARRPESYSQLIVVDNTNVQVHEYTPYLQVALASDYEVEIVQIVTPLSICLERQTHNVPKSTMKSMYNRFQEVLPWHKEYLTIINN